jgi:translation initiation factor IF-2
LILVGGIAYISTMEPELMTELLAPYMGESTPPPVATKPKPVAPAPVSPPVPTPQAAPAPIVQAPASPPASPTAAAAPAVDQAPKAAAGPATSVTPPLDPMFSEGQKVTVTADDMAPGGSIPLYADSASSKPGPVVRPGVSLTVMDGDLQPGGWMYLVRTEEGVKGWVTEKRLRLKF